MAKTTGKPFKQKIRIRSLRIVSVLVVLPLMLFTRPLWEAGWPRDITRLLGTLLIVAGVLGRFWAILYIGARKNKEVMQDGPYSVCRHPLYLSSTLGVAGLGFLLGGAVSAAVMTALVFTILNLTAGREEAFLRQEFGAAYDGYAAKVPRILPRLSLFHTSSQITIQLAALKVTYRDALVFLGFFPLAVVIDWIRSSGLLPMYVLP
jgi:protein-S-isoprenylcysteine O-methyltransferase Ste14